MPRQQAMLEVVLTLALVALQGSHVQSYPSGAPPSTCGDLIPHHAQFNPQESVSPYALTPAVYRITEGGKLRLFLSSGDEDGLAGFLVQARSNARDGALGSFSEIPSIGKALTCGQGIRNTLTHTSKEPKKAVELEWEPPSDFNDTVVFHSTFVKDFATYWVGVKSDAVQVVKRSVPGGDQESGGKRISTTKIPIRITTEPNFTPPSRPQATGSAKHAIYTGCGSTTLCFGVPAGCVSTGSCKLVVSVSMSASPPNDFTFQLLGNGNPGYVSVGLSKDPSMGDDQVVACTASSIGMYVTQDHDSVKKNRTVAGVELVGSIVNADGNLYCKFKRPANTTFNGIVYNLKETPYYLLIASGSSGDENKLGYHDLTREASSSALKLTEFEEVKPKSNLLYRLHGAFMLAAWIGFAGTGMLIARYFKKTWVGKQICGKDVWFAWHRCFMVITWTLTVAGFIIIFVEVGGWYSATDNPHGVLGVITTALAFFQPFGAMMRPAPSDAKRPIFNWSHWGVGNLAHLFAIITIFFAKLLTKAELPEWNDYIVATYVAFHVFMHILFSITDCSAQRPAESGRGNNFPMKEMGTSRMNTFSDNNLDAPLTCLRRFLLAIYLLVVTLLTVGLIVVATLAPIESNETVRTVVEYLTPNSTIN